MFSIRVKELFESIVVRKKATGFEAFSWETDIWVTLCDFTAKKRRKKIKIGMGNLYLTKNRLSRNEMWCAVTITCVTYVQKDF